MSARKIFRYGSESNALTCGPFRAASILFCASLAACQAGDGRAAPPATSGMPFRMQELAKFDDPWAMVFLPDGGQLVTEKGGTISVSAMRDGNATHIDIADNGTGIPEKIRERLFQPFAGTTRAGGSGLGLAIARDLARAHGGDVTLMKSDATGTQFRVTIPDREE